MNITKFVPKFASRAVGGQVLALKENSPHLFFGAGLVGVVAGTVLACRATLKAEPILDQMKEDIEGVKTHLKDTEGHKRDLAYVYIRGTVSLGRLYAPAIAVSGIGVACLTGSHIQLTRRNAALTVAYTGLHQAFNEYRDRVREELGEEQERDLYFGAVEKKGKKDGESITIKEFDPTKPSPYARFFDEYSDNWVKDAEYNHMFVQAQQHYMNQRLQTKGYVFLNEVYEALGLPKSRAGQVVGWRLDGNGDGYIDFNMYDPENSRFVNGTERSILLDFNVDGVILNSMED